MDHHDETKAVDIEHSTSDASTPDKATGDYHQSQLGPKPTRKHFFSPLDPGYADAVNLDAETVEFTEAEEVRAHLFVSGKQLVSNLLQRAVKGKIDRVVLPLIVCRCAPSADGRNFH
jgi:hypothetical protein